MELILELLTLEKDALKKVKAGKNPAQKETKPTTTAEPKKEPTKKEVDKKNEKEATFKVDGTSGKLVQPKFAPTSKFCKGDKIKIASGADECYAAHIGKTATVNEVGYCKLHKDTFYTVKLDSGKKNLTVYERDVQAA
jgi:hypothetical protein